MLTAARGKKKRDLVRGELYFLLTPAHVNVRTQRLKKGAVLHIARRLVGSEQMIVACGRDLGRTYEIPFNFWLYDLAKICWRCNKNIGKIERPTKLTH